MIKLNILAIAAVEDRTNLDIQIAKQTLQPNNVFVHVDKNPAQGINSRRKRIAENHKILAQAVRDLQPDLVWQLEGDSVLEPDTLQRLYDDFQVLKGNGFGYVSGIQVGRHGLYALGAWKNFTEDSFESINYTLTGLQRVEATGFYCLLAQPKVWLSGECSWTDEPYGPDVVWGRSIDKHKYVDMDIPVGHLVKNGIIRPEHMSTCNVRFSKINGKWEYKQL